MSPETKSWRNLSMQFSHCEKLQENSRVSCELVTPANSDGTRIVGDYTVPELRCPKSALMGLQGGKSGAWSLFYQWFYQVGTDTCNTEMRSIEKASGCSQWMGRGHCHQPSEHRWRLVLHPFLRLFVNHSSVKQTAKVAPFSQILCHKCF